MRSVVPGLCSVTLRQCTPREVVDVCVRAGLKAVEWGGDIHVPHGDLVRAREAVRLCAEEGIGILSYGSYFRLGAESGSPDFGAVLDTAATLGAKTIRIWAGDRPSAQMDEAYRARLVAECRRVAEDARRAGMEVGLEYHRNTATDTNEAAASFLESVGHESAHSYWQPREQRDLATRLAGLQMVLPVLCHLHVFQWRGNPIAREPLSEGAAEWMQYLAAARASNRVTGAFLEFVEGDDPAHVIRDARTLVSMVGGD